jgi:hypothetical protein
MHANSSNIFVISSIFTICDRVALGLINILLLHLLLLIIIIQSPDLIRIISKHDSGTQCEFLDNAAVETILT